ncbi:MAG: hypothetical protein AB7R55_03855 [Gemmatimonadales bacterium]
MLTAFAVLLASLPAFQTRVIHQPAPAMTAAQTGPAPTGVQAAATPTSVLLRWGCPQSASGYDVFEIGANGVQSKLNPMPIAGQCIQDLQVRNRPLPGASPATTYSQSFTHTRLAAGSTHTYVVVALYPDGATGAAAPVTVQVSLFPAPAGFTAAPSGRSARLSWAPVPDVSGYQVHRMLAGQPALQQLATVNAAATSWVDPTILPPGQHSYVVQAVSGFPAAAASLTMPPWPAPAKVSLADLGPYLTVTWDLVAGVTAGYLVFRQRQGEAGFSQLTLSPVKPLPPPYTSSGMSHQDQNPILGQPVSYHVQAVDGDRSAIVSTVPGSFRALQLTGFCGEGALDFRWGGTGPGAIVKVLRAGAPKGPYYPTTEYPGASGQFVKVVGNPIGVIQYYKLQAIYPGGVVESVVVPITIPVDSKGFEDFPIRSTTPVKDVVLEWQCR